MPLNNGRAGLHPALFAITLLFLSCGAIYLVFPNQHYRTDGFAVLVKYVLLVPLIVAAIAHYWRHAIVEPAVLFFVLWSAVMATAIWAGTPLARVAVYWIPSVAIFVPSVMWRELPRISAVVIILALVGAIYEYSIIGGFARFNVSPGGRAISIFLNPNNMAITVVVLLAIATQHYRGAALALLVLASIVLVALSKSNTGIVLLGMLALYAVWRIKPILVLAVGATAVLSGVALVSLNLVRAPWMSGYLRFMQVQNVFGSADNLIFPRLGGVFHIDNALLFTWMEAGLPAAIVLALLFCYALLVDRFRSPLPAIFVVASLTTNIIFLWPLAYLFWAQIGSIKYDAKQ